MAVVSEVELLQAAETHKGGGLDEGDVVRVEPKHDGGRAEVALQQDLDLVVLQEDTLTLGRDALRNHLEVVCLAADCAGRAVANAVLGARLRQLQPT